MKDEDLLKDLEFIKKIIKEVGQNIDENEYLKAMWRLGCLHTNLHILIERIEKNLD
jgi:hypothetical protein